MPASVCRVAICIFIVPLLIGCADTDARVAATSCRIERAARLPLRLGAGLALVPTTIDGTEVTMGVDTGSQVTSVTQAAATRLRLPIDPGHRTIVNGTAGSVNVQNVTVEDFELGGYGSMAVSLPISELAHAEPGIDPPLAGLLGADMLSAYDVEFDFPAGTMTLFSISGCARVSPPWQGQFAAIPVQRISGSLTLVPLRVNDHPLQALFDTGAQGELMTHAAARQIGVEDASLQLDPTATQTGAGHQSRTVPIHRFDTLKVGGDTFAHPTFGVSDGRLAGADMLLGINYMRGRRFWLSYATHMLFVQAVRPAP